jgi:hypothetical protein
VAVGFMERIGQLWREVGLMSRFDGFECVCEREG